MRILLIGASGDAGSALLHELIRQGHEVTALMRSASLPSLANHPKNLHIHRADILNDQTWFDGIAPPDAVISCLASRNGHPQDARDIEFHANQNALNFALRSKAKRFMLLSAICVQKPKLVFQFEKLRFEKLLSDAPIDHIIIRPTAFFKSLSGQIKRVKAGKPFLVFGDGQLTASLPLSLAELASFMAARLEDPQAIGKTLPIGGPGPAITPLNQAHALFDALGLPPKIKSVTPRLFDGLGAVLWPLAKVSQWGAARAEFLRIGKYYATESMLVWDQKSQSYRADLTPQTGTQTLSAFYEAIANGAQDIPDLGAHKLF